MGKVYIVGAGPGDPDLISVKGVKCIKQADVILYDRLVNKELLSYAKPNADLIYCGKLPNYHTMKQETIHAFLVKYAKKGKIVTRLKGGDPFVFGRGGEEAEVLAKQGIPFEIVPGITAGIAASAYAGIPVTHRDASASFAVVTGHRKDGAEEEVKWENLAKGVDTLAVYMGVSNLPYICEQLLKHGKEEDTPVAIVEWGTTSSQRTITGTLGTIVTIAGNEQIQNPSMIVIGEVVRFREKIHWFEQQADTTYPVSGVL
ncbi:uroporphyrinogen-III C-methyltransferase [Bacillus cereus]|uniref:uroporphyrinogen-III C-methyltransferase n=1 Tax=unclassified Bacillus (in: firmicutes) TaxID=185979 RepID=UPI00047C9919|nr:MULTISPECIES: uroporphyrinogen-III C-methyltransferase [unclassified Bacillus (in: firmicutes)]PFE04156.1 uroporphyrinogen-III C-methyltransferase [Bacillus sp. AFS023182]PGY01893.1 uroporphyrinogen-III C-methyltransferase [Bacillus cereus]SDZ02440.1 uroporphyrinogen-III C-methyltransferase [Bacillus sp. 166amftsu]